MTENENQQSEQEGSGPAEQPAGDHEVDPADNPGPRGNQDADPERVDRDREDLDRAGAN